jgi:hypothetical protein
MMVLMKHNRFGLLDTELHHTILQIQGAPSSHHRLDHSSTSYTLAPAQTQLYADVPELAGNLLS